MDEEKVCMLCGKTDNGSDNTTLWTRYTRTHVHQSADTVKTQHLIVIEVCPDCANSDSFMRDIELKVLEVLRDKGVPV
jgi:hypothetical protein